MPPIWAPTWSPSRRFEQLFVCGPNFTGSVKGKFSGTPPFFSWGKPWFPLDFPFNQASEYCEDQDENVWYILHGHRKSLELHHQAEFLVAEGSVATLDS